MTPSRRTRGFVFVLAGAGLLGYQLLSPSLPHEQHVRLMLGATAPKVTRVDLAYVTVPAVESTPPARRVDFAYRPGDAPRVVSHDPELPNGRYLLKIDVISTAGQSALEREVELSGKTISVDLVPHVRTE